LGNKYTLAWDIKDNSGINKMVSVIQKWVDQGISVNHYNPNLYEGNKVPAKVVIKDMIDFYKYGGKQLYYANTLDYYFSTILQKKKMKQDVDQVELVHYNKKKR
jgi:ribonucleoside-diphosphate reductase alpha chain